MTPLLVLLISATFEFSGVDTVVVDAIEINHLHDGNGCFFLHQVIFWDITSDGRRVCQGWKDIKHCTILRDARNMDRLRSRTRSTKRLADVSQEC
jgi:hypothetical protein